LDRALALTDALAERATDLADPPAAEDDQHDDQDDDQLSWAQRHVTPRFDSGEFTKRLWRAGIQPTSRADIVAADETGQVRAALESGRGFCLSGALGLGGAGADAGGAAAPGVSEIPG